MNEYTETIIKILNEINYIGFKNFRPLGTILTEDSKEVCIMNNRIFITPVDDCLAITMKGTNESVNRLDSKEEMELKSKFRYYIDNTKNEHEETYTDFVNKRRVMYSDLNPHVMSLYLKSNGVELNEHDKVKIKLETYPYNESKYLIPCKSLNIYTDYYSRIELHTFCHGIILKKENLIEQFLIIEAFRNNKTIEIEKFKLYMECDRWYK